MGLHCHYQQGQCKYKADQRAANCTNYGFVTEDSEEALKEAVATIGPISVAIDATRPTFILFRSGLYSVYTHNAPMFFFAGNINQCISRLCVPIQCLYGFTGVYNDVSCTQKVNHGVLAVGYGTLNGQDYWLVKNRYRTYLVQSCILSYTVQCVWKEEDQI